MQSMQNASQMSASLVNRSVTDMPPESGAGCFPCSAVQSVEILGFPVANMDMQEAVAAAVAMAQQKGGRARIVTANPEILYHSDKKPEWKKLLQSADLLLPDGIGLVKAAALLGKPLKTRVTGVDLIGELADWAAKNHASVYLLGAKKESVEGTVTALLEKHPALKIVGWHDGYFDQKEKERILAEIRKKQPDFLFIGMGYPVSDAFFAEHKEQLPVGLMIGVGGSFDVISGTVKRAPVWIMRRNLEWAYRFAQNPRRLNRFWALPAFMIEVCRQKYQIRQ